MTTFRKTVRVGMAAALLFTGLSASALGFGPGGGGIGFGGIGGRGMTRMTGKVLCAACSVDEVRQGQPDLTKLYQLNHQLGQVVMQIQTVNGSTVWRFSGLPELGVRAKDSLFQQLAAEENLMKDIELVGILSKDARNLDIFEVIIRG